MEESSWPSKDSLLADGWEDITSYDVKPLISEDLLSEPTPCFHLMNFSNQQKINSLSERAKEILGRMSIRIPDISIPLATVVDLFLSHRLEYLNACQNVLIEQIAGLREAFEAGKVPVVKYHINGLKVKKAEFELEKGDLILSAAALRQDLYDSLVSHTVPGEASISPGIFSLYEKIKESYIDEGDEMKFQKEEYAEYAAGQLRRTFSNDVSKYYGTRREPLIDPDVWVEPMINRCTWCVVLGKWFDRRIITRVTPLVSPALKGRSLDYLFGEPVTDLCSARNALPLHYDVSVALLSGEITIVPASQISSNKPSEWKVVVLDRRIMDDPVSRTSDEGCWKDLDQQLLKFPNNNRPAWRYMYFRHMATYISNMNPYSELAVDWSKIPKGEAWSSPAGSGSYFRRPVVEALAELVGSKVPADVLETATFVDSANDPTIDVMTARHTANLARLMRDNTGAGLHLDC